MTENGLDDLDTLPPGEGYDDGVPSPSSSRAPQTWADVEALALVEADLCLREHVEGELAREERRREGADPPRAPRRGPFR